MFTTRRFYVGYHAKCRHAGWLVYVMATVAVGRLLLTRHGSSAAPVALREQTRWQCCYIGITTRITLYDVMRYHATASPRISQAKTILRFTTATLIGLVNTALPYSHYDCCFGIYIELTGYSVAMTRWRRWFMLPYETVTNTRWLRDDDGIMSITGMASLWHGIDDSVP